MVDDERSLPLGGPKQQALLAVLLLHRGEAVSSDRLIDELWDEQVPATAAKTLQVYVSNLRKALGGGLLTTRGHGYMLAPESDQVDCDHFEQLAGGGRAALERGDTTQAREQLADALALWRGRALSDFSYEAFAQPEIARLEEARLMALEYRIDADLALGQHAALVPELEGLVREHPLRERLYGQLMLALYRSGRQADGLDRYQQARRKLIDELGIQPGPGLQELERAILNQDPALGAPRRPLKPAVSGRVRWLLVLSGVLLVAAAAAAAAAATLELLGGHLGTAAVASVPSDSVALISPASAQLRASFRVGGNPSGLAVGAGAVWALNAGDRTVTRIDLASHAERTYGTDGVPVDIAIGDGSVWIVNGAQIPDVEPRGAPALAFVVPKSVSRLDPVTASTLATIPLRQESPPLRPALFHDIALGPRGVWVANANGSVSRIDPASNRVVQTVRNVYPLAIASGAEGTWAAESGGLKLLARLSPDSGQVAQRVQVPALSLSGSIALGAGAVWLADPNAGALWRIEPPPPGDRTRFPVERTVALARGVSDVTYGAGAVWVANTATGTVSRIDPRTNRVTWTISIGNVPGRLTVGGGGVWVAVAGTSDAPTDTSIPTAATLAAAMQQNHCPRAPVVWTAVASQCVYVPPGPGPPLSAIGLSPLPPP